MTLNLLLDSRLAKLQRDGANQKSHDFRIYFNPPIILDSRKDYKIALNRLITMSYSWYNIATQYNNNKLKWRKKGGAWKTLTFPDGMYDYTEINRYIQAHTGVVDPDAEEKKYVVTTYFSFTLFRVVILKDKDHELDLTDGEFAGDLLGFDKKILAEGTNLTGTKVPDISRGVDWVFLHCDLVTRAVNDVASDVLYSLSTVDLQVSYPFKEAPRRLEYHPVNKTLIDSVGIRVTDGRDNILDLNDIDVALGIIIDDA